MVKYLRSFKIEQLYKNNKNNEILISRFNLKKDNKKYI